MTMGRCRKSFSCVNCERLHYIFCGKAIPAKCVPSEMGTSARTGKGSKMPSCVVALAQAAHLLAILYCLCKGCAGLKQWLKLICCKIKWPAAVYCTQIVIVGRWQTRLT